MIIITITIYDSGRMVKKQVLLGMRPSDLTLLASEKLFNPNAHEGADSWRYILRLHVRYFADNDGINGLLEHIGEENPFLERIIALAQSFSAESPRAPFAQCTDFEPVFRDLVTKMTRLDPRLRISARDALEHSWFTDTEK
ncbi:hypothetical protein F5Y16DRAFT_424480 [Xylariaceae sp. FL0255]|nr:hypothetical protein F5Y16DRAFT_424480 [Xylariaceae sp. FL0255]